MKYYTLESLGAHNPHRWIDDWPFVEDMDFDTGEKIGPSVGIPDPLECPLQPLDPMADDNGPEMPAFFEHLLSKGYTKIDFMDLGDVALGV
jgi:hypothetical protein